jgi:hypothetical protein
MGGSKKGERRGNARKRAAKPEGWRRTHETPGEIMKRAVRAKPHEQVTPVIERRIKVSRMILGYSGAAEDTTPKEALLQGMHHNLQAARDWIDMLQELAQLPPTAENALNVERAEREIERLYDKMAEFAFKVGPFIHPRLQAIAVTGDTGANQVSILQELFDDIDERERNQPIPIEHKPSKTG